MTHHLLYVIEYIHIHTQQLPVRKQNLLIVNVFPNWLFFCWISLNYNNVFCTNMEDAWLCHFVYMRNLTKDKNEFSHCFFLLLPVNLHVRPTRETACVLLLLLLLLIVCLLFFFLQAITSSPTLIWTGHNNDKMCACFLIRIPSPRMANPNETVIGYKFFLHKCAGK